MRFSANTVATAFAVGSGFAFLADHGIAGVLLILAAFATVE